MSRRLVAAAAAVLLLGAVGCTGIPNSTAPQVVGSPDLETPAAPPAGPTPGENPKGIVQDFLNANASSDVNHNAARRYLTPTASSRWSDDHVTIVDTTSVGPASSNNTVSVSGSQLGSIDATGAYTPVPTGNGTTGTPYKADFVMKQLRIEGKKEWRIDKLPAGLLISSSQFEQSFQQRVVYFYDAAEQHLVTDPRFTQLLDPAQLASWLLRTLAAGPRDALSSAEQTELPAQTDVNAVAVTGLRDSSGAVKVLVPGAALVDRGKLAVQLAATLSQVAEIGTSRLMTIEDGRQAVSIPSFGTSFSAGELADQIAPLRPPPDLYYIDDDGGVVDEQGRPLPGRVGSGYYDLTSVALAPDGTSDRLLVAGTRGPAAAATLDVGTTDAPLRRVPRVQGRLSRPSWSPVAREVWIGDGPTLYRVTTAGVASVVPVATTSGPVAGEVVAVRFSPLGTRVALVLQSTGDHGEMLSRVWVGVVVRPRAGGRIHIEGLAPITPAGIAINDVAWNDELRLFAVGHDVASDLAGIYDFQCDGSRWNTDLIGVLPNEPDSITVVEGQVAAVSVDGTVWKQRATTWESPQGEQTDGTNPVYLE